VQRGAEKCLEQATMLPFKIVSGHDFYLPIGNHVFPWQKYRLICSSLLETRQAGPDDFIGPSLFFSSAPCFLKSSPSK
jgi:hypothetical protein